MLISATIFCQDFLNVATVFKMLGNIFLFLYFFNHFIEMLHILFVNIFEVVPTFFRQHFSEKLPIIFQHFS
jgi:hypothetical protein